VVCADPLPCLDDGEEDDHTPPLIRGSLPSRMAILLLGKKAVRRPRDGRVLGAPVLLDDFRAVLRDGADWAEAVRPYLVGGLRGDRRPLLDEIREASCVHRVLLSCFLAACFPEESGETAALLDDDRDEQHAMDAMDGADTD